MQAVAHAIPTLYRGVQMRSRLEARWAAFFDSLRWPWTYEPFDLAGYIPDFVLTFERPLLVEVKPAMSLDDMGAAKTKIDRSGWDGEALVVGAALFELDATHPIIGAHRERDGEWDRARLFFCLSCGSTSLLNESGSWRCRVCDQGDGNAHVGHLLAIVEGWNDAGNRVQWRPE